MTLVNSQPHHYLARFEVLTVVWMKIQHSWNATPCNLVKLQAFQRHYAPEDKLKISNCFSSQTCTTNKHTHTADDSGLLPCCDVKLRLLK